MGKTGLYLEAFVVLPLGFELCISHETRTKRNTRAWCESGRAKDDSVNAHAWCIKHKSGTLFVWGDCEGRGRNTKGAHGTHRDPRCLVIDICLLQQLTEGLLRLSDKQNACDM